MTLASDTAVMSWLEPETPPQRGTVVVLPGRGESPEVYERFGRRLTVDAYRVHAVTAPTQDVDRGRDQLLELLAASNADLPRIVVGSDAGGAYAAYLAASGELAAATALVLAGLPTSTGPAADTPQWDAELDVRTSCPAHRARISGGGVRPAELFTELPAGWLSEDVPARITVPVLGLHGAADVLSPIERARRWYAAVPRADLVSVAAGRHDVLNDQTHRSVAATVVLFLERLRTAAMTPITVTEQAGVAGATEGS